MQISTRTCPNWTKRRIRALVRRRILAAEDSVAVVSVSVSATQSASQSRTAVVDMVGLTRKMEETAMIRARQRPNATSRVLLLLLLLLLKNQFNYDKNNTTNDNNNSKTEDQSFSSSTTDGGRNASRSNTTTISMTTTRDNTNNNSSNDTVGGAAGRRRNGCENSPLDQSLNTSCSNSSLVNEEGGTPRFGTFLSTLDDLDFTNAKILRSLASCKRRCTNRRRRWWQ